MNIYECSEADLATIPKIGTKTAKAIKDLVQEVKKETHAPLTVSDLAAVKYSVEFWTELLDKGTLSIDYTPVSWHGEEKGHEVKYVTEETFKGAMSFLAEQIEKIAHRLDTISVTIPTVYPPGITGPSYMAGTLDPAVKPKEEKAEAVEGVGAMADPAPVGSPKEASPKAPAKLSASDLISKITTIMPKSGVYGKDFKKAEPHSKKGEVSKDPPIDCSDKGGHKVDRDRSRSPQPPKMSVFTGDPNKQSWLSFISKFERIAQRRKWTAQKRLDRLFDCLSETALEYANRCEGQNDYVQLRAELARRFDLRDTPVAARQKLHTIRQKEDEGLEVFLQRVLSVCLDGFPQTDAITLQNVATEAFLRGTKHRDEAIVVINESPTNIQQACKRLKTVIANKQAISGQKVSFKERVFTAQEEDRVSRIEQRLDSLSSGFRESSRSPARGDGRNTRGDSPTDNFRQRNYWDAGYRQRSPSYGRDWRHNNSRGNYEPRDWQSRGRSPTQRSYRDDYRGWNSPGRTPFQDRQYGSGSSHREYSPSYSGYARGQYDRQGRDNYSSPSRSYNRPSNYQNRPQNYVSQSPKPPDKRGPVSAAVRQADSNEESLNSNGLGVKATNA